MAVAKGTQISGSWQAVYDLLTDSSKGLTDPQSRGISTGEWVISGHPDIQGEDFPGFPVVGIRSPDITSNKFTIPSQRQDNITVMISIVTDTLEDLDTVSDDVLETIMANKDTLVSDGLRSGSVTRSATSTSLLEGEKKVHQKNMFFRFKWWGDF